MLAGSASGRSSFGVVGSATARNHISQLQELRRQIEIERTLHSETWSQQNALSEQIEACQNELLQERGEQQFLRAQLELSERAELTHAAAASALYSQIEEERNFVRRELATISAQEEQAVQELRLELRVESSCITSELRAAERQTHEASSNFFAGLDAECRHWDLEIVALGEALREVQRSTAQEAHVATDLRASQQQCLMEASEAHGYLAEWHQFTADLTAAKQVGQAFSDEEVVTFQSNNADELEVVQREQDLQAELAALYQDLEQARCLQRSQAELFGEQVGRLASEVESSKLQSKYQLDNVFQLEAQVKQLQQEQAKLQAQLARRKDTSSKARWGMKSAPLLPCRSGTQSGFGLSLSMEDLCRGWQPAEDHPSKPRRREELSPFIKRKLMQHDIQLHKFLDDILPKALTADESSAVPRQKL